MGDNSKKDEDEGVDLLSKLFEEESSGGKTEAFSVPTQASYNTEKKSEKAEGVKKLGTAFEVSTSELNTGDVGQTEFLSADSVPDLGKSEDATEFQGQAEDLFKDVLNPAEPLAESRISFFKSNPKSKAAGPEEDSESAIDLGAEIKSADDPIESALKNYGEEADSAGVNLNTDALKVDMDPILDAPSEISSSDFGRLSTAEESLSHEAPRGEMRSEDFAEVFAQESIPVADIQSPKKAALKASLRKTAFVALPAMVVGLALWFGVQRFKSDEGIFGYRLEGLGLVKAYRAPTSEQIAGFSQVFRDSDSALLSDSPELLSSLYTKLQEIIQIDERNSEALSRMLDHSAQLIAWYGGASEWAKKFDEALEQINLMSQKSKVFVDTLTIERAKARRQFILGDSNAAQAGLEKALQRFNLGDDLSYLLIAEILSSQGQNKSAEGWLAKVGTKDSNRSHFIRALVEQDISLMKKLAESGYLPAEVQIFSASNFGSVSNEKKSQFLDEADKLLKKTQAYPLLTRQIQEFKADLLQNLGRSEEARTLWQSIVEKFPKSKSLWIKLAGSYQQDAVWDSAIKAYEQLEKMGDLDEVSLYQYADLLRIRGRLLDSSGLVKRGLDKNPNSVRLSTLQGRIFMDLYQSDVAKDAFQKALKLDPKDELANLGIFEIAMLKKQYSEAQSALKAIPPESPYYAGALVGLGRLDLSRGNLKDAEDRFWSAIKSNPKLEIAYVELVNLLLRTERDGEAEEVLTEAIKLLPRSPELAIARARLLQFQRKYEEAHASLEPIRKTHDHLMGIVFLSIDLMLDRGAYTEAEQKIKELQQKDIRDVELNYLKAKLFAKDPESGSKENLSPDLMIKSLDAAMNLHPEVEKYRLLAARISLRGQDRLSSQEWIDSVLKINPRSVEGLSLQGDFYMEGGAYESASKSYQQALKLTKYRSDLYSRLAEAFKQMGKPALAIDYYQKVVAERPKDAEASLELGKLYNQEGRYQAAMKALKKAIALSPNLAEAYYFLGYIEKDLGDSRAALKSFERFLELAPASTESATVRDEVYFLKKGRSSN